MARSPSNPLRRIAAAAAVPAAAVLLALGVPRPAAGVTLSTLRIGLSRVASGLNSPVAIAAPNDGTRRMFIVEQNGRVRLRLGNGTLRSTSYLDIRTKVLSGGERGMLGLAFHQSFKTNGYFFVTYTNSGGALVVARFRASPSTANTVPASTQTDFMTIAHPTYDNHNGGQVAFGPDGYLYIGTGDGGGNGDPGNNAHDTTKLLGKILRIDVDSACSPLNYCIPSTNPYASSSTAKREIWEYGLRNPWRFSFDRSGGALWIADVGQGDIEEISRIGARVGGKNFGWDCWEGTRATPDNDNSYCTPLSATVRPVTQYDHSGGDCAVIGGFAYRGSRYAANMTGVYLYGDYCTGRIRGYLSGASRRLYDHSGSLTSFGEDTAGELYAVDAEGGLYRVTASGGVTKPAPKPKPKPSATKSSSPTPASTPSASPPVPATPSPGDSPLATGEPSPSGGAPWGWIIAGLGLSGGAVAGGIYTFRRRRSAA